MSNNRKDPIGVSFIIPVYNKAKHLPSVIKQIKLQRGDFPKQYIFLDDGSTDGSLDIVRSKTANWENVIISSQPNSGSAAATNTAISFANQPFLKFVDADDLLTERATVVLLNALMASDACLIFGDERRFTSTRQLNLLGPSDDATIDRIESPLRLALKNSLFNPSQFLVRTDAVRAVGGCDERVVHSQEYGLTLRLARRWPFLRLNDVVTWLPTQSEGRLSTNEGRQLQRVTRAVAHFLYENPDLPFSVKSFACKRLAGRSLKYVRRRGRGTRVGRWYFRYLAAQLNLVNDHAGFAAECVAAFKGAEKSPVGEQAPNY